MYYFGPATLFLLLFGAPFAKAGLKPNRRR